jgi:hypothetical protein
MADVWLQALLASPPVICGRRLLPFSLAHALLLRKLGSPYACGGPERPEDLLTALEICSRPVAALPGFLARPPSPRYLRRHARRWAGHLTVAGASFRTYLGDFLVAPARFDSVTGAPIRSPVEWYLAGLLMAEYGWTEQAAWDCPFAKARCLAEVHFERNGDDGLVPEGEVGMFALMARANQLAEAGHTDAANVLYQQVEQMQKRRTA